ncbi:MAG: hypothetical protein JNK37_10825 [Verrucomicrobiales bacterium]|nr:hypothetical protein [Verrucomicrobiales bacterium]
MPNDFPTASAVPCPAPAAREPRPAPAIAHRLRQELRGQTTARLSDGDWAQLAASIGAPEAQVRTVAAFFEEFSGTTAHGAHFPSRPDAPPRSLTTPPQLIATADDTTSAFSLLKTLATTENPAATLAGRLSAIEGLARHRIKAGRGLSSRWAEAAATPAAERFVICHTDAGNPGSWSGEWLLEHRPGLVIAGMCFAALAIGAGEGVICVDRSHLSLISRLRTATEQARAAGVLPDDFEISVFPTFGSPVGGEETALLNAIEGRVGEARSRPPEPEVAGIFGKPTVVESAEIFARLPGWLRSGRDDGQRLIGLLPPFAQPGLVEIDATVTLRQVASDAAGADGLSSIAALTVGGRFGSLAFPEKWDTPLDLETLRKARIEPANFSLSPVPQGQPFSDWARDQLNFAMSETCGRCLPCRLGPLAALGELDASGEPTHRLREILDTVAATSLCGFGRDFPRPILQWIERWRHQPAGAS